MHFVSVSLTEIEDHLVDYFSKWDPAYTFFPATDVRARYRYRAADWMDLAGALSRLDWMRHLGVVLIQDDMRNVSTIEQVATVISKRLRQVIVPAASMTVTPLSTLSGLTTSRQFSAAITPPGPAAATQMKRKTSRKNGRAKKTTKKRTGL